MNNQSSIAFVITLLSFVLTPLTSLVKQEHWPSQVNAFIALAIAGIGGVLVVVMDGGFHGIGQPGNWAAIAALVYAGSQAIYHGIFRNSPIDQALTGFPGSLFSHGDVPPPPPPPAPPAH